jgi:hypothetical protein
MALIGHFYLKKYPNLSKQTEWINIYKHLQSIESLVIVQININNICKLFIKSVCNILQNRN